MSDDKDPRILVDTSDDVVRHELRGMFQSWFLDYASYVILERAVPHIDDGLKPVQRRILHSMKLLDDGRFNKVANIVGNTMQFHPHGDASIYEALVQLGQKDLLVETQGNWGNILTGAGAAAGRYIEARLSPFALDVVYNPKVTEWTLSYDGRKKEPVTFPMKFPLLLSQGVEGIAVGLSSKILPHNFNEIIDAAISHLRGEEFTLYPDFPTGGFIDVSRYNDGERGGSVKIRAKIDKIDNKTLAITEIPYGKTTATLIDSILKAFESGKIKIRKVDDNTAEHANILVHLLPGTSSDRTIDALYAFTDCEVSVSPNCCVISDKKPHFIGVSDVLRHNVDSTRRILGRELEIQLGEVREQLHFASLERIFIEERIYKDREYEESENRQEAIDHIRRRFEPWLPKMIREITDDDIIRLFEIKMGRILKFNSRKCEEQIAAYLARIDELNHHLAHLTEYTIEWYQKLKTKYGAAYPRMTQIRSFDNIQAATVAEANEKLYINREEGFIGTGLKKDEFLCNCSSIDDVIIFYKDGRYKVVKVQDKLSVGKGVIHVDVFKRNDERTIYNVIYQNGKGGTYYMKRFRVTGITRDREYNLTPGEPGSKICWFTANPNGEAEVVKVTLKPKQRLKTLQFDVDFSELAIKGRGAMGNIVTRNEAHRFTLKKEGVSTLGGRDVWYDPDVNRLNYEGRGRYLGEFNNGDYVLVITNAGEYYTSSFEASNHYPDNVMRIEKYVPHKAWTAILNDADQGYPYLKRFTFEPTSKPQRYLGENDKSTLILLSDEPGLRIEVTYAGADAVRPPLEVTARDFVAVKSYKAKGKRLTTYPIDRITELEPVEAPGVDDDDEVPQPDGGEEADETVAEYVERSDDEVRDEITGQTRLFE
ncbi:MAG: DNA gyrase/topoisomerase IV subunit A [Bacteroides sp.]|nr:DNA gyrase/topoisomerase IV subunit A [Bacteroides sp.]